MRRPQATPGATRRQAILLAATALTTSLFGRHALAGPQDQGIGGTGASAKPPTDDSDRGIGGTGVIGTIRKFGSIIVNDLRIAYPPDATVHIDGKPASVSDLKLGQVVRVTAEGGKDRYATRAIDVTSEVVGPVQRVKGKILTVAGQTVSTAGLKGKRRPAVGERVAVSGLRRPDGTVMASLIEPRAGEGVRVAGPVVQEADGSVKIGALKLTGIDGALIGQRAVIDGKLANGHLAVTRGVDASTLVPRDVERLSVEAYVERRGNALRLGSGLPVSGSASAFPAGRPVRTVLTTSIGAEGQLTVQSLRANGRQYRATPHADAPAGSRGGPGGPRGSSHGDSRGGAGGGKSGDAGRGGSQSRPMDFDRTPRGEPATPGGSSEENFRSFENRPGFGGFRGGGGGGPGGFGGGRH